MIQQQQLYHHQVPVMPVQGSQAQVWQANPSGKPYQQQSFHVPSSQYIQQPQHQYAVAVFRPQPGVAGPHLQALPPRHMHPTSMHPTAYQYAYPQESVDTSSSIQRISMPGYPGGPPMLYQTSYTSMGPSNSMVSGNGWRPEPSQRQIVYHSVPYGSMAGSYGSDHRHTSHQPSNTMDVQGDLQHQYLHMSRYTSTAGTAHMPSRQVQPPIVHQQLQPYEPQLVHQRDWAPPFPQGHIRTSPRQMVQAAEEPDDSTPSLSPTASEGGGGNGGASGYEYSTAWQQQQGRTDAAGPAQPQGVQQPSNTQPTSMCAQLPASGMRPGALQLVAPSAELPPSAYVNPVLDLGKVPTSKGVPLGGIRAVAAAHPSSADCNSWPPGVPHHPQLTHPPHSMMPRGPSQQSFDDMTLGGPVLASTRGSVAGAHPGAVAAGGAQQTGERCVHPAQHSLPSPTDVVEQAIMRLTKVNQGPSPGQQAAAAWNMSHGVPAPAAAQPQQQQVTVWVGPEPRQSGSSPSEQQHQVQQHAQQQQQQQRSQQSQSPPQQPPQQQAEPLALTLPGWTEAQTAGPRSAVAVVITPTQHQSQHPQRPQPQPQQPQQPQQLPQQQPQQQSQQQPQQQPLQQPQQPPAEQQPAPQQPRQLAPQQLTQQAPQQPTQQAPQTRHLQQLQAQVAAAQQQVAQGLPPWGLTPHVDGLPPSNGSLPWHLGWTHPSLSPVDPNWAMDELDSVQSVSASPSSLTSPCPSATPSPTHAGSAGSDSVPHVTCTYQEDEDMQDESPSFAHCQPAAPAAAAQQRKPRGGTIAPGSNNRRRPARRAAPALGSLGQSNDDDISHEEALSDTNAPAPAQRGPRRPQAAVRESKRGRCGGPVPTVGPGPPGRLPMHYQPEHAAAVEALHMAQYASEQGLPWQMQLYSGLSRLMMNQEAGLGTAYAARAEKSKDLDLYGARLSWEQLPATQLPDGYGSWLLVAREADKDKGDRGLIYCRVCLHNKVPCIMSQGYSQKRMHRTLYEHARSQQHTKLVNKLSAGEICAPPSYAHLRQFTPPQGTAPATTPGSKGTKGGRGQQAQADLASPPATSGTTGGRRHQTEVPQPLPAGPAHGSKSQQDATQLLAAQQLDGSSQPGAEVQAGQQQATAPAAPDEGAAAGPGAVAAPGCLPADASQAPGACSPAVPGSDTVDQGQELDEDTQTADEEQDQSNKAELGAQVSWESDPLFQLPGDRGSWLLVGRPGNPATGDRGLLFCKLCLAGKATKCKLVTGLTASLRNSSTMSALKSHTRSATHKQLVQQLEKGALPPLPASDAMRAAPDAWPALLQALQATDPAGGLGPSIDQGASDVVIGSPGQAAAPGAPAQPGAKAGGGGQRKGKRGVKAVLPSPVPPEGVQDDEEDDTSALVATRSRLVMGAKRSWEKEATWQLPGGHGSWVLVARPGDRSTGDPGLVFCRLCKANEVPGTFTEGYRRGKRQGLTEHSNHVKHKLLMKRLAAGAIPAPPSFNELREGYQEQQASAQVHTPASDDAELRTDQGSSPSQGVQDQGQQQVLAQQDMAVEEVEMAQHPEVMAPEKTSQARTTGEVAEQQQQQDAREQGQDSKRQKRAEQEPQLPAAAQPPTTHTRHTGGTLVPASAGWELSPAFQMPGGHGSWVLVARPGNRDTGDLGLMYCRLCKAHNVRCTFTDGHRGGGPTSLRNHGLHCQHLQLLKQLEHGQIPPPPSFEHLREPALDPSSSLMASATGRKEPAAVQPATGEVEMEDCSGSTILDIVSVGFEEVRRRQQASGLPPVGPSLTGLAALLHTLQNENRQQQSLLADTKCALDLRQGSRAGSQVGSNGPPQRAASHGN